MISTSNSKKFIPPQVEKVLHPVTNIAQCLGEEIPNHKERYQSEKMNEVKIKYHRVMRPSENGADYYMDILVLINIYLRHQAG